MEMIFAFKEQILTELSKILKPDNASGWQKDVHRRLGEFVSDGKIIRGCLTLYTQQIFDPDRKINGLPLSCAFELVQAAFLIHDDIMDRDEVRRGESSLYVQYKNKCESDNLPDALHKGLSLAICAGDAAIFLAYEQIGRLECNAETKDKLIQLLSSDWQRVCCGQMQDIWLSGKVRARKEEVLRMYTDKTARYTFSLPLVAGGILTKQTTRVIRILSDLGEKIGLVFQLRDDELNFRGNPGITGKPLGSDSKNNKLTYLLAVNFDQRQVKGLINKLETEAGELIGKLPIKANDKQTLVNLVEFVKTREK